MSRKSPQEKKALSYAKDRRNAYGANDKASRKSIPLRKRLLNKANRHADRQRLDEALGRADVDQAESAEQTLLSRRPTVWRKQPDRPLGEHVERRRARRGLDVDGRRRSNPT